MCDKCVTSFGASYLNSVGFTGTRVAQSVERPTSAQAMISQFLSVNLASGSVLTAQSLEPALHSGFKSPVQYMLYKYSLPLQGAWVAQSVERPTSAQVMILWFMSSSPKWALF